GLLFAAGKRDEGRREYESSFEAAKRYPLTNAAYVAYTDAQTQLAWAQAEAQYGEAERAREHLAKGQKYAATLPSTAWNDALKQQFALLSQQLGG
ncbi:MAG TPA: hypothetical protein VKF32_03325, partial [Thermoanaerobaculia bacterium]|nr:hypothetical protein [Thermoanaerobaculia bacterium]